MTLKIHKNGVCHTVHYDEKDHHLITQYKWHLHAKGYAYAFKYGKAILMHRLVLGIVDDKELVSDHINHNRLDNRRENLRGCNRSENQRNVRPRGKSKYLGVTIREYTKKSGAIVRRAKAMIKTVDKYLYLGYFKTEKEAALAYDRAARKHHGEFANLNFRQ